MFVFAVGRVAADVVRARLGALALALLPLLLQSCIYATPEERPPKGFTASDCRAADPAVLSTIRSGLRDPENSIPMNGMTVDTKVPKVVYVGAGIYTERDILRGAGVIGVWAIGEDGAIFSTNLPQGSWTYIGPPLDGRGNRLIHAERPSPHPFYDERAEKGVKFCVDRAYRQGESST